MKTSPAGKEAVLAQEAQEADVSQSRHAWTRAGTDPDDSEIVRLWESGKSWPAITAALGRDVGCRRAHDRWHNCLKTSPAGKEAVLCLGSKKEAKEAKEAREKAAKAVEKAEKKRLRDEDPSGFSSKFGKQERENPEDLRIRLQGGQVNLFYCILLSHELHIVF